MTVFVNFLFLSFRLTLSKYFCRKKENFYNCPEACFSYNEYFLFHSKLNTILGIVKIFLLIRQILNQNFNLNVALRINLINFTIRVPDTSDTNAIRTMRVRYECYANVTSATRATQARHKWGMSAAQTTRLRHKRKILVLITTGVKTYIHKPIVAI